MEEAIKEIQKQLWRFGFGVKNYSGIAKCDLLVEGKWRVKIIFNKLFNPEIGTVATKGCDVVAVYTGGKKPNKFYSLLSPGYKISDGSGMFKDWTKSPKKIFK